MSSRNPPVSDSWALEEWRVLPQTYTASIQLESRDSNLWGKGFTNLAFSPVFLPKCLWTQQQIFNIFSLSQSRSVSLFLSVCLSMYIFLCLSFSHTHTLSLRVWRSHACGWLHVCTVKWRPERRQFGCCSSGAIHHFFSFRSFFFKGLLLQPGTC